MHIFSQYIFIPLIVKQLDNNVLKYLDGLLPTNEINIAEKFMELFGLNPNLEYSSLIDSNDIYHIDNKLYEAFRKRKEQNSLPKTNTIVKIFKNSHFVLKLFSYSKMFLHFHNKFAEENAFKLIDVFRKLIDDKLQNRLNSQIFDINVIRETILLNLKFKLDKYSFELNKNDLSNYLKQATQKEQLCKKKKLLDSSFGVLPHRQKLKLETDKTDIYKIYIELIEKYNSKLLDIDFSKYMSCDVSDLKSFIKDIIKNQNKFN